MFQRKSPLIVLGLLGLGITAGIIGFAKVMTHKSTVAGQQSAASDKPAGREPLLDAAAGQIPNNIGSDRTDNVRMTTEDCTELGGKALKVVFASPDSFGDRQARVPDWTGFECLQFDAFNPGRKSVPLTLTVKHGQTTNYQTRVDVPVLLKPGKSSIRIAIGSLVNTNGSAPDLTQIKRWYFALESPQAATFYLGNLWLVKEGAPAQAAGQQLAASDRPAGREPLLDVAAGQIPNDIGSDRIDNVPDDERGLRGTRRKGAEGGFRQPRQLWGPAGTGGGLDGIRVPPIRRLQSRSGERPAYAHH